MAVIGSIAPTDDGFSFAYGLGLGSFDQSNDGTNGGTFVSPSAPSNTCVGFDINLSAVPVAAVGDWVAVVPRGVVNGPPKVNYYTILAGQPSAVVVRVDDAAGGNGKYTGKIMTTFDATKNGTTPPPDISSSSQFSASDLGTGSIDCIIINLLEIDNTGNDLTDPSNSSQFYFIGTILHTNADGTPVVAINGFYFGC